MALMLAGEEVFKSDYMYSVSSDRSEHEMALCIVAGYWQWRGFPRCGTTVGVIKSSEVDRQVQYKEGNLPLEP